MNTVFRVDGTDGDPLIRIDRNKEGKYELHWLHPYAKCEIGEFDDEMIKPRKDMFCYYLHPELLESDIKEYEEMDDDAELIADVDEVDSFHIGYGQFHFLRKELGELVGIRYDDSDVFNTRIYYDDCYKNTSLLNFFLHSDCDGDFSTDEIQESYEQFTKYCDKEMLREKKAGKWAEEINSFLKFWKESADKKLQWEFC